MKRIKAALLLSLALYVLAAMLLPMAAFAGANNTITGEGYIGYYSTSSPPGSSSCSADPDASAAGSSGAGGGPEAGQDTDSGPSMSNSRGSGSVSGWGAVSSPDTQPAPPSAVQSDAPLDAVTQDTITIPLSGFRAQSWGLVNLLASLLALAIATALLVRCVRKKAGPARYAACAAGCVPLLLFFALESFGEMALVSRWTPLFLLLLLAYGILAAMARKQQR